ncbi:Helothermine [Arthrobotrys entomopaga]|nr:Helothermine [Arthrobotrys entomopaga]
MKVSSVISLGIALASALAIPIVQQREGKSSTVQKAEDIFKRGYQFAGKRKSCTKSKTRTRATHLTPNSIVPSIVASGYEIVSTGIPNSYTNVPVATHEGLSPTPRASGYTVNNGIKIPSPGGSTTGGNTYGGNTHKKSISGHKKSSGKTTGGIPAFNITSIATTYDTPSRKSSHVSKTFKYTKSKPKKNTTSTKSKPKKGTTASISKPSQSTTGQTPSTSNIDTSSDTTSKDTTTAAPKSYLTMPAGSSTGLAAGASVAKVGTEGSFMAESAIMPYLLAAHNIARSLHEGTNSITWNSTIAKIAQANTPNCKFAHTPGAQRLYMGENISYNTNASPEDQALRQWYANEVVNYDFSNPSNSVGDTGHMTAMVWKSVTSFGCAVRNCGKEGMGLFLKCNYAPTANVIGYYTEQVGVVSGASTKAKLVSIVTDATGFAPAT